MLNLKTSIAHNVLKLYYEWKKNPFSNKSINPIVGFYEMSEGIDVITEYKMDDNSYLVFEVNVPVYVRLQR